MILSRPCQKNFNRTLLKKFSAPPQPPRDRCELINRTLHEIFLSGSDEEFSDFQGLPQKIIWTFNSYYTMANAQKVCPLLRYALTCTKIFRQIRLPGMGVHHANSPPVVDGDTTQSPY
jgi:hypothetical protein